MSFFLKNFEKIIGAFAFVVMLLMVVVNVIARYFFGHSFNFTEEIAYIGFTYCVFFGVCVLFKKEALISIDILVERLPFVPRRILNIVNYSILTILNLTLTILSTKLSTAAWVRPTASLRLPYTFIDISAAIAFFILTIHSLLFVIHFIRVKEVHKHVEVFTA